MPSSGTGWIPTDTTIAKDVTYISTMETSSKTTSVREFTKSQSSAAVGHIDSQGCRFINRQTFNDNMCQADYYNYIVKEGVVAGSLSDQDIEDITLGSYARREGSMLVCICGTRHRNAHALRQHLRSPAHEPALYECPCCGFHRQTLSAILSHLESGACPGDRGQQELAIEDIWDMAVRAASGTW
ncbi:hypothetical protein CC1G_00608 [Coprinopsis cinerea okayama7|uniref:C2H2-type domain-containing protein n=1 Tax=Coprinopsis cinerea (strain Okayama-7 / 130 / ATCC MYA-4618 / FGSC 9003) TaxID=240176 RepID=A8N3I9_COPC7|nr:hypothetical protein CC1G_00608 [Coprinopsis cinerea okayama7\|eukprot:XP_001829429.2 hypothetical protein CC1G_00608 [Coprinopsis cinerea okayama7\